MNMAATFSNEMRVIYKIHAWVNPANKKTPRLVSFIAAIFFHAILFFIGGLILVKAPEYGLDMNQGGVDIYLMAAPAPTNFTSVAEEQPAELITQKSEMDIPVPNKVFASERSAQPAQPAKHRGDGSSPKPGESATTLSSAGSGFTEAKPGYLKNAPPNYPSEAVEKGQEGLVLMAVEIDRTGHPQKVELKQSSGFYLLDRAALKAVKKWKFSPARMGALAVDTQTTVPVRFRLEDLKKK